MTKHLLGFLAALGLFAFLALPASASHDSTPIPVSIGKVSLSNRGQTATVNVTFTCAVTGGYDVSAQIYQTSGRLLNFGRNWTTGTCVAEEVVTVSVPVTSQLGIAFKAGPAQVIAGVNQYDTDTWNYFSGETAQTVRLGKS